MEFIHHYFARDWSERHALEPELIEQAPEYGLLWDVNTYFDFNCERKIRQGNWSEAEQQRHSSEPPDVQRRREVWSARGG